jgi:ABC-type bacteriocin/lantibiotic exporter with double-glycine peptidase domain
VAVSRGIRVRYTSGTMTYARFRHRSRKLTSIHVAHNLNFARCADRVVALERGKLIPTSSSSGPCSDSERGRNHV